MGLSCFKSWKHDSTRHKGNRDVLASPGSYFFLSNSTGQGDEWLKTMNRGVWIPFTGVFGQRLEETVLYERKYGVRLVPLVVEQCVAFIRDRGLHEAGLFLQPGQTRLVQELRLAYDSGERPMFDSSTDVHTVASLLKLYLRQLPEPLVPYSHYQHFLQCGRKLPSERTQGLVELRYLLHELPVANFNLLNFICQFLNEVQSFSRSNKTSCNNLASVFGPNILRCKTEDPQSIVGGAALGQLLMQELIREYHRLFSKVPPPSLRLMASSGAPCLRQRSLPLITERDDAGQSFVSKSEFYQKKLLGHRHTSSHPDTCLFLAPGSCSPAPRHLEEPLSKADALSWIEAWTDLRDPDLDLDPDLDYWTPEAPNEGLASLSSSASTYDNLSGSFQNLPGQNGGEQKADESWSSCDIIPWEETESPSPNAKRRMSLAAMETTGDTEVLVQQQFESVPCTTPTSRSDPSLSPLSTGSSEVFLPSGPPELQEQEGGTGTEQPTDLHSLLGELQRQMARQREEYQARIQRLERCNDVLERQVALLRLTLEQQKRSHSVAETRIKHMQREKEDAEQRNHRLRRDLDSFYHTDSDVTNPQTDAEKKKKKKKRKTGPPQTRPLQSL